MKFWFARECKPCAHSWSSLQDCKRTEHCKRGKEGNSPLASAFCWFLWFTLSCMYDVSVSILVQASCSCCVSSSSRGPKLQQQENCKFFKICTCIRPKFALDRERCCHDVLFLHVPLSIGIPNYSFWVLIKATTAESQRTDSSELITCYYTFHITRLSISKLYIYDFFFKKKLKMMYFFIYFNIKMIIY